MKVVEVSHLTKDFGSNRGIFNVNFEISKGEVFGFLGPNGAGKTTTIRHLMGFTKPGEGNTTILGLDSRTQYTKIMEHVGYLPGEIALPEGLTGWQFIRMMQKMRHSDNEAYLNYLLEKFELDPAGSTKRMSLGNKRKLAIVTAFMDDPEVLILDEPTSGLDPVMQEKFIEFMLEEKKRGKTILLSSHIFKEIEQTCDRISIIKDGRIVAEVDANTLKNENQKHYFVELDSRDQAKKLSKLLKKEQIEASNVGATVEFEFKNFQISHILNYLQQFNISKISETRFNLENYFLDFYKSDKTFRGITQ